MDDPSYWTVPDMPLIVEGHDHLQELGGTCNSVQEGEEARLTDRVKHLGQVNEAEEQGISLFMALLL